MKYIIHAHPTKKGEVYWILVKDVKLLAYRYTQGAFRTRYKIKYPENLRAQWVAARKMLKEYPIAFSLLRDATGARSYDL